MLKSFTVKKYRNLNINNLNFGKLNLIIGPNNAGKSNLIDALNFSSSVMTNEHDNNSKKFSYYKTSFLNELQKRGWNDILDRHSKKPNSIELSWVLSTFENLPALKYSLKFKVPSDHHTPPEDFEITSEKLNYASPQEGQLAPFEFISCHSKKQGIGKFSVKQRTLTSAPKTVSLNVSNKDSVLNQLESLLEEEVFRLDLYPNFKKTATHVTNFFTRFRSYRSTDFNLSEVKKPIKSNLNSNWLEFDAKNFVNVLAFLEKKYSFLKKYEQIIKEILPDLDKITIEQIDDTYSYLQLTINKRHFKLSEMSDGTIKMLLMALILWSPEKYSLLSLDEPELNIHPAWLRKLANWIKLSNSYEQIFVSSHSPDFLDGFTDYFSEDLLSLLVFNVTNSKQEKDINNQVNIVKKESLITQLEQGWELGDLYRIGEPRLGGWPW
ncbi:AAA family ATPase [Paenibacillus sp. SGZ-1009]|uniref:AAA family ATPase n=1 Tax=Paenibacillus campi TaxID=3106031 RepID=UPI002B002AFC|nr:AAA family ATPase [Paenibacillus sp. SGZ-1009]